MSIFPMFIFQVFSQPHAWQCSFFVCISRSSLSMCKASHHYASQSICQAHKSLANHSKQTKAMTQGWGTRLQNQACHMVSAAWAIWVQIASLIFTLFILLAIDVCQGEICICLHQEYLNLCQPLGGLELWKKEKCLGKLKKKESLLHWGEMEVVLKWYKGE